MKKILSLVCVALMGIASATAQIKVTCDGQEVKDGDVLTHYAVEDPEEGTVVAGPLVDPTYTASAACNLKVTLTYDAGITALWCGVTQQCEPLSGTTTTRQVRLDPNAKPEHGSINPPGEASQFLHVDFEMGEYKEWLVNVDVYVDGNKYMTFYQNFVYSKDAGIGSTTADAGVKMVGNNLVYSFASDAPRSLKVYSVDGKLVKSVALSKLNGSVSLGGLQNGVYVYSLLENGKQAKSGKVVLK